VVIMREGQSQTLQVTLGRLEEGEVTASSEEAPQAPEAPVKVELLGLSLTSLTAEARQQFNILDDVTGVLVEKVDATSPAFEKGLRAGDVIVEIGQEPVRQPKDCEARVKAAREAGRNSILLLVQREGQPRFVALTLDQ
ncbi:MAG TPA: PDZ domain-containing protein, partial [Paracoccaceae bacterium]|nr:PDZ domain-containing protein [Paracoccaceae bacterium]